MSADAFDSDWPSEVLDLHASVEEAIEALTVRNHAKLWTILRGMRDALTEMVSSIPDQGDST
jgi:hypothetical protein